uniref:HNH nuclease domain-containing protein n=1 Tax=viral metagenome TaxID=1070528 RepID=A0A6C0EDF2_9ZZZZ
MISMEIKKNELKNVINENMNKIDKRQLKRINKIVESNKEDEIEKLLNSMNNGNFKLETIQQKRKREKIDKKRNIRRRNEEEIVEYKDVYVSVKITILYKYKNRKSNESHPKDYDIKLKINIPKQNIKDKNYIKEYLKNGNDIKAHINEPFENYTEDNEMIIHSITFITEEELENEEKIEMIDMFMENATYPNIYPNETIPYEHEEHQCVYGALKHHYGWNKEYLFGIFRDFYYNNNNDTKRNNLDIDIEDIEDKEEFTINSGVSSRMLLHLAKLKDFSLYCFDLNYNLFEKNISRNRNLKSMAYIMANHHLYLITDPKIIKSIAEKYKMKTKHFTNLFRGEKEDIKDTFDLEIIENIGVNELNNYTNVNIMYSENDLTELHFQIFKDNNDLLMRVRTSGKKIIYIYYEKYKLHLHADINYHPLLDLDYKKVMKICEKIKIPYKNQSITSIMKDYENMFFGIKRIKLSKTKKNEILTKQSNKCNICKIVLDKKHYDHIRPLSNGGTNDLDNIQALCIGCHLDKTRNEQEQGVYVSINQSESTYNKITSEIFNSNLSKFWAFIEKKDVRIEKKYNIKRSIDINKCRRNILLYGKEDYPVYTVLDKPENYNQEEDIKTGFYFIESKNYMPLRGNGWYSHNMIKYCLENKIINKNNILYKLIPSLTIKNNYFKSFIENVVNNFDSIHKQGPNFFIGSFFMKNTEITKMTFTTDKKEALNQFFDGRKNNFIEYYENILYKIYKTNDIEFNENRIPIYLQILEEEAIELHKMETLINKYDGIVSYYNTDNCIASFKKGKSIDDIINNNYWDDDKKVLKYKYEDIEYKVEIERKGRYIRDELYKLFDQPINIKTDEKYDRDFSELVDEFVNSKKSGCILGRAGCGKSHLVKLIIEKLKLENNNEDDIDRIIGLAPTNKAAIIINGQTIHKFVASYFDNKKVLTNKLKNIRYIIVDEISMMTEIFYNVFLIIKKMFDIKFILVGDFGQLEPVGDRVGIVDYEKSPAFLELCDYNKLILEKCRRSDNKLFDLCKDVKNVDTTIFGKYMTFKNLSFTNKKRKEVNETCMTKYIENKIKKQELTEKDILIIKKEKFDENGQDIRLTKGMPIISKVNRVNMNIVNNQTFIVKEINKDIIIIEDEFDNNIIIEINKKDFSKLFYIAFCITVHKSQGATYNTNYTIHEWNLYTDKMKYVSLSRSTDIKFINIIIKSNK